MSLVKLTDSADRLRHSTDRLRVAPLLPQLFAHYARGRARAPAREPFCVCTPPRRQAPSPPAFPALLLQG